jgi:UDP-N-acetylmuramoyl-tripeptide--D-alanyl-D-alanine ligase
VPPVVPTFITQHTLWQALTGELPPMALPATPVGRGVLDSRDIEPGDLFVALVGQQNDGHDFIAAALNAGAGSVICEQRGVDAAVSAGAVAVDCTQGRWSLRAMLPERASAQIPIAYIVDDAEIGLQNVGGFQRLHRARAALRVVGITGSVGKTSTKELTAAVLSQRYRTLANQGNLNSGQGLPLTLLGLSTEDEYAVLEMGMYGPGEISRLCELARPHVGVISNVGPSHLSRLGSIEAIQAAKAELPQALPSAQEGGVAILNWDDERVRAMADMTPARVFRYGLTSEADLWADEIQSAGMDGIRFRFHYRRNGENVDSLHVRVPLLGRHSVHTALRAAAVGLVEGLGWDEIISGMQSIPGQLRLVVMPGINDSTIIDDTYNASPASTIAALNLLADLKPEAGGRRVAILGDMLELGQFTDEGHKLVGRRAADVVETLVAVGDLGKSIGEEARFVGYAADKLHVVPTAEDAIALLQTLLQPNDVVLVKGSRAIGMEKVVSEIVAPVEDASHSR